MKLTGFFLILFTFFGVIACNTDKICNDTNPTPGLVVEFYKDTGTAPKNKIIKYYLPDTLTVKGIGSDSILVKKLVSVQRVVLPINNNTQTCTYTFVTKSKSGVVTNDELKIDYETRREFLSPECGFKYNYLIKSMTATTNRFDSIVTLQTDITNEASTALRIYFK